MILLEKYLTPTAYSDQTVAGTLCRPIGGPSKARNSREIKNGAAGENRTPDLTITNGALYH